MALSPAAIGAISSVGTSVINGLVNYGLQTQQQGWNQQMMDKQNDWNLNMWNMTNEYNDPANQKQRLLDAGLNPLYFGLDGSSANAMESAQALGYNPSTVNFQDPYKSALNAELVQAQIENTRSDTAKKNNETISETVRREKMLAEIDNTRQMLNNLKSQEGLNTAQIAQINKSLEWADRLNQAVINEKESSAKLNESQKKRIETLLDGEKLLQSKTIEDFDKKWLKIDAEISKMAEETGLLKQDIENYALNHASNGFFGTGVSFQNLLRAVAESRKSSKNRDVLPTSDNFADNYTD